jgi:uncharacterized protein (DUF58 family)
MRGQAQAAAAGAERGDFRALREYRPGDDPRDIHWRSTARAGEPIIRQYERDASDEYWIVLDTGAPDAAAGEAAVEVAASLMARAHERGDRAGLAAGAALVPPGSAGGRLEAALDVLASVSLSPGAGVPSPPVHPERCVLVTARGGAGNWGDVHHVTLDPA